MKTVALSAKVKNETGSRLARNIRRQGEVPAIVYGHGMKPLMVQVSARELQQILHTKAGGNVIIDLNVADVKMKESTCLIKDIQHNPVTDRIDHVDFTVISMTEKIKVKVNVFVLNAEECAGAKEGGVVDLVHHEVEVECLPTAIPEKFEVDVKGLKINDSLHVKDMKVPSGVTCLLDPEEVIVAVHPPRKDEEIAPAGEGQTEPEVMEKGKKPAEEGEAATAAAPAQAKAPAAKAPAAKPEKK